MWWSLSAPLLVALVVVVVIAVVGVRGVVVVTGAIVLQFLSGSERCRGCCSRGT